MNVWQSQKYGQCTKNFRFQFLYLERVRKNDNIKDFERLFRLFCKKKDENFSHLNELTEYVNT